MMNKMIEKYNELIKSCDEQSKILSNLSQITMIDKDGISLDLFEGYILFEELKDFALNKITEIEQMYISEKWNLIDEERYDKKYIVLWNGKNESSIARVLDKFDLDYSFENGLSIQDTIVDIGDIINMYIIGEDIKITIIKNN